MVSKLRTIIREEIKKLLEVSDHFYGMKKNGHSVKISYYNFVQNLELLLQKNNINLESLVKDKQWSKINTYLESALDDLSPNPNTSTDFKNGKYVYTHDTKENIISKIRLYLVVHYGDAKIEKRKKST